MKISFGSKPLKDSGTLVVTAFEENVLSQAAIALDKQLSGALSKALKTSKFKGKVAQTLVLTAPAGVDASRVVLLGLGKADELSAFKAQKAGGALYALLAPTCEKDASLELAGVTSALKEAELAAHLGYGCLLRSWRCDRYKTKQKQEDKPTFKELSVASQEASQAEEIFKSLDCVARGVFLARDVVTMPPNLLYPESYANRIKEELAPLGVKVEIMGVKDLKKLGMGSLLGVGQGSAFESFVVVMIWDGGKKGDAPVSFVGKGVTFDTGGISIKPAGGMDEMKYDMAGSAAVVGVLAALAGRKAKVNAVGVVGLVENMPSGNAQRPGDIVTSMSGQTIEVLNTDAEGRLVLADALWYTQQRFKPQFMVDLATLTGAIVVCLGDQYAGLFSNNDDLSEKLAAVGEKTSERLWRLPLGEAYDKMIDSPIADMKNISEGRKAGSTTAAQFLQRFVNDTPWAHLDIAGMAWADKDQALCAKGATAFGVRLLDQLVRDHYEA